MEHHQEIFNSLKGTRSDNSYALETLPQNDYLIKGYLGESQFTFQPSNVFRLSLGYSYGNGKNETGEVGEKAINNKVTLDLKYNVISKSVLTMTATFADVNFTGASTHLLNTRCCKACRRGRIIYSIFLSSVNFPMCLR